MMMTTMTTTGTMTTDHDPRDSASRRTRWTRAGGKAGPNGRAFSVRTRLTAFVSLLLLTALASVGGLLWALESARVEREANAQIDQELAEFRALQRQGRDPETTEALTVNRLIELFLVRVLGFGWDEVHEEAEHLEHVVSDRLIARIDEMLGRPVVDPHGDPIPDAEGAFERRNAQNLLTCPLGTPVTVTRVVDQDKAFLRFIESHDLKPGQSIVVEARDTASDSVRLRGSGAHSITIGARAASKLLVEVG